MRVGGDGGVGGSGGGVYYWYGSVDRTEKYYFFFLYMPTTVVMHEGGYFWRAQDPRRCYARCPSRLLQWASCREHEEEAVRLRRRRGAERIMDGPSNASS